MQAPFQWERKPEAEKLVMDILEQAIALSPTIDLLFQDLFCKTNTRLFDWIDHLLINESEEIVEKLKTTGFIPQEKGDPYIYFHPAAQLPRIVLQDLKQAKVGIALSVDSIADFLMVRGEKRHIEGSFFGNFRRSLFSSENGSLLWVIERRGTLSLEPTKENDQEICRYFHALEKWMCRPRSLTDEDRAMGETLRLVHSLIDEVGQYRAAWTVLEGERRYWQARNSAAQIQKNRQDKMGMGWANHDHHTFRSSRKIFNRLVHLFELLGFQCRERFYAGKEAGWGAQVMENPTCRLVLFLDVDLGPDEVACNFAHNPLPELDTLGTVGLWCALHGDSILKAGMHHLEAQFMFNELKKGLDKLGIKMMTPFSDFDYLKQAFTVGEMWPVNPERIEHLLKEGKISQELADRFREQGALGSHLENLQRREGYKGFNQKNVSFIIKKTDPRLS